MVSALWANVGVCCTKLFLFFYYSIVKAVQGCDDKW